MDPDRAYARALEMEEQGVDIIDIGGVAAPISVDTYKSGVAENALALGAERSSTTRAA